MAAGGSQGGTGLKCSFLGAAVPFYQSVAVRMSNTFTSFQDSCMHHTSQCQCQSPLLHSREAWMSLPWVACCFQSSPPRTEGDVFHRRLFCSIFFCHCNDRKQPQKPSAELAADLGTVMVGALQPQAFTYKTHFHSGRHWSKTPQIFHV